MIRKLRLQVVAVCMLLVTALLGGMFFTMYASARRGIQSSTQELLRRVITSDPRVDQGQTGIMVGGNQVLLPYFTVEVWNGTAYVTGGTYSNLENTDALQEILQTCMDQNSDMGTVPAYNLRFLRGDNGFFERIAFVDISMELSALHTMIRSSIQVGAAALLALLGVSILLAYFVTRPVERAWRQQRQFLSDASHELKTPLTVILSNADLLGAVPLDDRPSRWADNIRSEAGQMKALVEEMLILARADNMVRTSVFSALSLSDAAMDCALLFEPVAFEAGKALRCDAIAPDISVSGDGDKLKQVISILLDNAIKYGAENAPIELSVQKQDRHARLQVANQGDPIPPEQLRHLFERFYRADSSRGEQEGFGLGLSIAQSIAAEHRGTLRAESDSGSTRFILTLPLLKK